ncbi:MAG: tagatose 1,6-diphosphate aldolase [Anaerolineales bacterium]|jgi:tagatose-1,6-bisphosphate aldolase
MTTLSIGKLRGLQQCTSERATFTCLALDHRQNLRRALNPADPASVSDLDLTRFKLDVTAALAGAATAVLLDPQYSAAQSVAGGILPRATPFVVAVESTGYGGEPTARQSQILPGWSVEKAKRMGSSMIKLLVYYHPDSPAATQIEAFVRQVAQECSRYDLALMLEPLSYSLEPDKKLASAEKKRVVSETACRLTVPGVDVLKVEFPLEISDDPDESEWDKACREISSLSQTPWILLSAAGDYPTYLRQVEVACQAGASGCAVGRAVWQEAVSMAGPVRLAFLKEVALPRLEALTKLCAELARPWTDFYTSAPITPDWYRTY